MPYLDPDLYAELGPELVDYRFNNTIPYNLDTQQIAFTKAEADKETMENLIFGRLTNELKNSEDQNIWEKRRSAIYDRVQASVDKDQERQKKDDSQISFTPIEEEMYDPSVILKSNLRESLETNKSWLQQQRIYFTTEETKATSFGNMWNDFYSIYLNRNEEAVLTRDQAEKGAKAFGVDIKWNKEVVTQYEFRTRLDRAISKKKRDAAIEKYYATGDITFLQHAQIFGANIVSGMFASFPDAGITALSFLAPELLIGRIAAGGRTVSAALQTKRILEAGRSVNAAKAGLRVSETALKGNSISEGFNTFARTRLAPNVTKAMIQAKDKTVVSLAKKLEDIGSLSYGKMTVAEKMLTDTAVIAGLDVPQAVFKKKASDSLGIELYTEKDMLTEILLAGSLGAVVPTGFRMIGGALGHLPKALKLRKIKQAELDIKGKRVLGTISEKEATEKLETLKTLEKEIESADGMFRKQPKGITKMVEDLQMENVSNETIAQRVVVLRTALAQGKRLDLVDMPQYETILSRIDSRVLSGFLNGQTSEEVFGDALVKSLSESGIFSIAVNGETGLLSTSQIKGFTEAEVLEQLANLYRGTVLRDKEALDAFRKYIAKYTDLQENLVSLVEEYKSKYNANIKSKEIGAVAHKAETLVNLEKKLREIWLRFKLSDKDYDGFIKKTLTDMTDEEKAILEEVDSFVRKWVTVKESRKKGVYLYDFTGKNRDEGLKSFEKFMDEIEDIINSNAALANIDKTAMDIEADRLLKFLQEIENGIVPQDTDIRLLLGLPRVDLDQLNIDMFSTSFWERELSKAMSVLNGKKQSKDYAEAFDVLDTFSADNETSIYSVYKKAKNAIDKITAVKNTDLVEIKNSLLDTIRNDSRITNAVIKVLTEEKTTVTFRGLERNLKDVITKSLSGNESLPKMNLSEAVHNIVVSYLEKAKENPRELLTFLSGDDLKKADTALTLSADDFADDISELGREKYFLQDKLKKAKRKKKKAILTEELDKKEKELAATESYAEQAESARSAAVAEEYVRVQSFLQPLDEIIRSELTRLQLQYVNDMNVMGSAMKNMLAHPESPMEAWTGLSTMTLTHFNGSGRSIENIARTSVDYFNALLYDLRKERRGAELVEYLSNPENVGEVYEALVQLKHGKKLGTENSNAEIIANKILNQGATHDSFFKKLGSTFNTSWNFLDTKKLRFADAAIPETEISGMQRIMHINGDSMANTLENQLKKGNLDNPVKYGDKELNAEDAATQIKEKCKEMSDVLGSFFKIESKVYRNVALWVFRDMDLNKMFNREGAFDVNLNSLRDHIINGKLADFIGEDFYTLRSVIKDLKTLRTKLLGSSDKGYTTFPGTDSFIWRFMAGFDDFSKSTSGQKSAFLDDYGNRLVFKDAESELYAISKFGYDTIQQAHLSNTEKALKARFSLEYFGSNPIAVVEDTAAIYNKAVESDSVSNLGLRLRKLAQRRGKSLSLSDFKASREAIKSATDFARFANGMQERSTSGLIRFLNATRLWSSASMLTSAGVKGLGDWGTIWSGLTTNALIEGRFKAMDRFGKIIKLAWTDPKFFKLINAAGIIEQENLIALHSNNPAISIAGLSSNTKWLDNYEMFAKNTADFFFNKFSFIGPVTNWNKQVAGMAIQMGIGDYSHKEYKSLSRSLRRFLERDGINEIDWDLIRTHLITDLDEAMGTKNVFGKALNPYIADQIPDSVLINALKKKGELNITKDSIEHLRYDLQSKAFVMVDAAADEFISLPSERVMSAMRFGQEKGSAKASIAETITQFKSFGVAVLTNTYGRAVADAIDGEVGITIFDALFKANRSNIKAETAKRITTNLLGTYVSVALFTTFWDSVADVLKGDIQSPILKDGSINLDLIRRRLLTPTGVAGEYIDAVWNAVEGTGQGSGGIAFQVAPFISRGTRAVGDVLNPITSSNVAPQDKPIAVGAAAGNVIANYAGVKKAPILGPIFQSLIGAHLDYLSKGGYRGYKKSIDDRVKKGYLKLWYQQNPVPFSFPGL